MVALVQNLPTGATAFHFFCELGHSRRSAPKSKSVGGLHAVIYGEGDQLESCSRDPIGLFAGFNVFSYVESMPVVAVDPFGFESVYPEDATKVLAFKLMAHYYNGGNLPFRDFAIGLKVDTKISEDAARVLRLIATAECTQRVCAKCESRAGNSSKKLKTQPVSRWLIHTTNVPSDGFYLDIDWFADSNGTCCDCCTIDFVVDYQWRDWADLHPDRYFFPDGLVSWIPADGPYWIDIRWRDNATVRMPCRLGGCDYEESGWPFESPEFMVRAISIPRGPIGGPR